MENNQPIDILDSVVSETLTEISTEILEAGIDQLIENELLKDIPILGIGYKTYNLAKKITEHFLIKKILKFLFHLKDISQDKREKFIKELEKKKQSKTVSEKLLIALNRLDDLNKADIIGKLFKALIENDITQEEFFRLSSYVDHAYIDDLIGLKQNEQPYGVPYSIKENLAQVGFFTRIIKDNRAQEEYIQKMTDSSRHKIAPTFEYKINKFGELLLKFGL
ncbi:DUF2013 domain-containing protein [Ferruginibacter sp.]|jgi:hypothetical protein|uniref:leucine-rich domain-containing protein n=1 Tax=Ferruginibacter sp. TaxID=1940288 RepID=UPI00265AA210|nr:DUF2013 domain-containing protein [Ferruginibacter sp.]